MLQTIKNIGLNVHKNSMSTSLAEKGRDGGLRSNVAYPCQKTSLIHEEFRIAEVDQGVNRTREIKQPFS